MLVLKGDKFAYFDVDDTIIMWDYDFQLRPELCVTLQEPWEHGHLITLCKNPFAISAIIDAKVRGEIVVVWSQGGGDWAEEVVTKLGLKDHVDLCISKPHTIYDDIPAEKYMEPRIDLGKQYYDKYNKEK